MAKNKETIKSLYLQSYFDCKLKFDCVECFQVLHFTIRKYKDRDCTCILCDTVYEARYNEDLNQIQIFVNRGYPSLPSGYRLLKSNEEVNFGEDYEWVPNVGFKKIPENIIFDDVCDEPVYIDSEDYIDFKGVWLLAEPSGSNYYTEEPVIYIRKIEPHLTVVK